jgi:hypothetical protein
MSGKNFSILSLPPGIFSNSTKYAAGNRWYDGNQVRWIGETLIPIGGWRAAAYLSAPPIVTPQTVPTAQSTNVVGVGNYTFSATALGASATKFSIIGVSIRGSAALSGISVTVNAQATTQIAGVNQAAYTAWFATNAVVTVASANVVVSNSDAGVTLNNCAIFPYAYEGADPSDVISNTAIDTNTTLSFGAVAAANSTILTLAQVDAVDPIQWTWPSSVVDGATNVEASAGVSRLVYENITSAPSPVVTSGSVNAQRSMASVTLFGSYGLESVRDLFSWRDLLADPWVSAGSADKLWALKVNSDQTFTNYDITPSTLAWNPGGIVGFGGGPFGAGPFGGGPLAILDPAALWSFDNFGKLLVAVHSQDGRLFKWDPVTPTVDAVVVTNAPVDNELVVVTNEEFLMVLGGTNNPRRVKWASQRSETDWTATETNSAGGFDLQSNGSIISVRKVPEGILVVTSADAHLIQYIGAPNYYGRRRISDEGSIVGKNALTGIPNGAIWMGYSDFWLYMGGNVTRMACSVHTDAFNRSELTQPQNVFMGVNDYAGEVWAFFPPTGETLPSRYVAFSYSGQNYWTKGEMSRTAWLNPVWQAKPFASDFDNFMYEQEFGALADGVTRVGVVFAETGGMELGEGDEVMRADRIYQDAGLQESGLAISDPLAFTATFKLQQAPNAPERIYGPVSLGDARGYTTVRFRARQISMRIEQAVDEIWSLGKLRIRLKPGGRR